MGARRPVLVATRSRHKLEEIRDILADAPVRFLGLDDLGLPEREEESELEPFDTFAQNAISKARYFHARSGLPTIADDSGLCVDALGGGPGVRTKRFAPDDWAERWGRDQANNRYLLDLLGETPDSGRGAHYHCAIAVAHDTGHEVFEGRVEGTIAHAPRGEGGFGYDPLFIPAAHDRTYAELSPEVKQRTSHRVNALRQLDTWLRSLASGRS